jgi:hypothetical protein
LIDAPAEGEPEGCSRSEFEAFTGGGRYPDAFLRYQNGARSHAGFNFWAAIFSTQWFFFRKLYLAGVVAFLAEAGVFFALGASMRTISSDVEARTYALVAIFVIERVVVGYAANFLLYCRAVDTIEAIDKQNHDNPTHLRLIAHKGGVSLPALLSAYVLLGALRLIAG